MNFIFLTIYKPKRIEIFTFTSTFPSSLFDMIFLLLFLAQIVQANYKEANIRFDKMVCPNYSKMFLMGEKYGTKVHRSRNIYPASNYYELFICDAKRNSISSGCYNEIMDEVSFRYAHIPTLEFSFFVDKFLPREDRLVKNGHFDVCVVDGTHIMRDAWMKRKNAHLPSVYDRLQMPRKCWRVTLVIMPLDEDTERKMKNATEMKLAHFRKRRTEYYETLARKIEKDGSAIYEKFRELDLKYHRLFDEYNRLMDAKQTKELEAKDKEIDEIESQRARTYEESKKCRDKADDIDKNRETIVEDETKKEMEKMEKNTTEQKVRRKVEYKEIRFEKNVTIDDTVTKGRRKRNTDAIIEKLKKMKPKKQHLLLNLATHELLPTGTMDVNGLIEEIITIRKENTTPERAHGITIEAILNTSQAEWQKIAENDGIKEKMNMIAVNKMEEALQTSLLVDFNSGMDLETRASEQITKLKNSVKVTLEEEKTMKKQGAEVYREYREKLYQDAAKIMESAKSEQIMGPLSKLANLVIDEGNKLVDKVQGGTKDVDTTDEKTRKGKEIVPDSSHSDPEKTTSETEEDSGEKHQQYSTGGFLNAFQRSGELIKKSAVHIADLEQKHNVRGRLQEGIMEKSKGMGGMLGRIGTGGMSISKWAKDKAIEGMNRVVARADLWKALGIFNIHEADNPNQSEDELQQKLQKLLKEHPEKMEKLKEEKPDVYQALFGN